MLPTIGRFSAPWQVAQASPAGPCEVFAAIISGTCGCMSSPCVGLRVVGWQLIQRGWVITRLASSKIALDRAALSGIAAENQALREAAAKEAEIIIDYGLMQFERWRKKIAAQPEIVDLRARIRAICEAEVAGKVQEGIVTAEASEALAHSLTNKIAHEITALLARQQGTASDDDESAPFIIVPKYEDQ